MDEKKEPTVNAFQYQDDDGLDIWAFQCPYCGEINDIPDNFRWTKSRWQMTSLCEFCDHEDDLTVVRK